MSLLKWIAISLFPILAIIGGWNWLSDRKSPATSPDDNPAVVGTNGTGATPSPDTSPGTGLPLSQILNGSGNQAFLTAAQQKLEEAGYQVRTTGNASRRYEQTTVFYQQGHRAAAEDLARLAGAGVIEPAPDNLDKAIPLALVIGADFGP